MLWRRSSASHRNRTIPEGLRFAGHPELLMKAFTDIFVRRPVLAIVVNLLIIIAGLQAWRSLSVRQYPRSENTAVTVATVYVGASADVVRGFITSAIERSIASADGIEYVESK